jgi:hypothetical protein
MALRLRRSQFMNEYFEGQTDEENQLSALLNGARKKRNAKPVSKKAGKK